MYRVGDAGKYMGEFIFGWSLRPVAPENYLPNQLRVTPFRATPTPVMPSTRAVDPHSFLADPDPGGKMNADPDPAPQIL